MSELNILINKESIEQEILALKTNFEPEVYVSYGKSLEWDDKPLSEEEYKNNIDKFLNDFKSSVKNLDSIISQFPKKKNGTFNRRAVIYLAECENCIGIHEWHNTWIYQTIKVYAIDDTTLKVSMYEKVDTPA